MNEKNAAKAGTKTTPNFAVKYPGIAAINTMMQRAASCRCPADPGGKVYQRTVGRERDEPVLRDLAVGCVVGRDPK